jgi:hypothetical protein
VLDDIPGMASWTASMRAEPDVVPLLAAAVSDSAAAIVARWRDGLTFRFRRFEPEIDLLPKEILTAKSDFYVLIGRSFREPGRCASKTSPYRSRAGSSS